MNYLDFFELQKEPFHVTPDPSFLYLSPSHREALAAIVHGIKRRKGIITVTGEVGLGKTTILRSFLESEHAANTKLVYIFNSNISFRDLIYVIYEHLGLQVKSDSMFELVDVLSHAVIEEFKQGRNVVVIVDEAQNMPVKTLEQLRMLSNLETAQDKLIQLVLIGQPELEQKLNRHELRQLKQRIAVSTRLLPLTEQESQNYIQHRLDKVQLSEGAIFSKRAVNLMVKEAKGAPRTINILADNALITGFGYGKKPVSAGVVKEVIADRNGERRRTLPMVLWASILFSALFLGVVLWAMNGALEEKYAMPAAGPGAVAWKKQMDLQKKSAAAQAQLKQNKENQNILNAQLAALQETARQQEQQRQQLESRLQQQRQEQERLRDNLTEEESVRSDLEQRLSRLKAQQNPIREQMARQQPTPQPATPATIVPPPHDTSKSNNDAATATDQPVSEPQPATPTWQASDSRLVANLGSSSGQIPPGQLSFMIARPDSPRIVKYAIPTYPRNERKNLTEGTVIVSVLVNASGDPAIVRVVKGLDPILDDAALEAVRQWKFEPAIRNGMQVSTWGRYAVTFQLNR